MHALAKRLVGRQEPDAEAGDDEVLDELEAVDTIVNRGTNPASAAMASSAVSSAVSRELAIQWASAYRRSTSGEASVPTGSSPTGTARCQRAVHSGVALTSRPNARGARL